MGIDSLQELHVKFNSDPLTGNIHPQAANLVETRSGGDVQFMLGYVERYTVFEAGSLCLDSAGLPKKYVGKNSNKSWYRPTNPQER